jgi:hypothetical protein
MKRIQFVLKGIALAAVPLVSLHGCGPIFGDCGRKYTHRYELSPEELNVLAERNQDGKILPARYLEERVDGGPLACDELCLPPDERASAEWGQGGYFSCEVSAFPDGGPAIDCTGGLACSGGRRPQGFAAKSAVSPSAAGAWLAKLAQLEAASVPAFARLRDELAAHEAPRRLVKNAERARRDELRHARVVSMLARQHGAEWSEPVVEALPLRPLEEVVQENAVEGCVGETYGALLAWWQSSMAGDAAVRCAMGPIAVDESRHAALAWDVEEWAMARLSPQARRRIHDARQEAIGGLRANNHEASEELIHLLGLPSASMSLHLLARLQAEVWS